MLHKVIKLDLGIQALIHHNNKLEVKYNQFTIGAA